MRRTIQALEVVRVDAERNLLLVKGGVPGVRGSLVKVQASVKNRKQTLRASVCDEERGQIRCRKSLYITCKAIRWVS